ncbi:MAG TPA: hypothetical protein VIL87_18250 [Dermatophilaceae bacterium]|jgi:hypothetical protein
MTEQDIGPLHLTREVLHQAREFFEDCGSRGCEGTALIAGPAAPVRTATVARLVGDTLVVPDQKADSVPYASVTVTAAGDLQIVSAVSLDQRYYARIHSHPALAFHSRTDDENPALTHEGAISIVVPYFGLGLRHGLDACAVFLRNKRTWVEAPAGSELRLTVVSTDE